MLKLTEIPVAASTRKTYLSALANLDKWLRGRPVTDENLAGYLSYLFDKGKSPGHGEGVLKAVRWRARSTKTEDPRGELCQNAIDNFRRQGVGRGRGPVDGLPYEVTDKLVTLAAGERTIYGDRDAALMRVMSDAALRIGEAAAVDVEHIDFGTHTLLIPKSKVDQLGRGAVQFLTDRAWELLGVRMERGKITEGPLFRPIHKTYNRVLKKRIKDCTIRHNIKKRCKAAGIEGSFSGHSFRIGATESLTAAGATLVELQQVGRWTSPLMPAKYARRMAAQQSAVARLRNQ